MTSVSAATGIVAQDVCKSFGHHLVLDRVSRGRCGVEAGQGSGHVCQA